MIYYFHEMDLSFDWIFLWLFFNSGCGQLSLYGTFGSYFRNFSQSRDAHALFPTHDAILYAGLGTILGHDFPFWRHFHGGKGVACTCALLVMYQPLWGCIALVVGGLIVVLTKKLWLGGIVMPLLCIIPWMMQSLEAGLVGILVSGLSLYSFRKDIGKR